VEDTKIVRNAIADDSDESYCLFIIGCKFINMMNALRVAMGGTMVVNGNKS
jgi:hypothetical protein